MSANSETLFEAFLNQHDHTAWWQVVKSLLPSIHEVDRNATQIWFTFYPLSLARLLDQAEDRAKLERSLLMKGKYYLKEQIDSSHEFLYGHRYWPEVKKALVELASSTRPPASLELGTQIRKLAGETAAQLKTEESLLVGITAVAFMTLQQVGMTAFKMALGRVNISPKFAKKSPAQILKERTKDNGQGIFGFLKSVDKEWSVTFNENDDSARFKLIDGQDLAMGAANDRRDFRSRDQRCIEGPIPVECRTAACGTCWVGILGGAEKLGEMGPHERLKLKEFGYVDTKESKPLIRLACKADCFGAVSLVIPPWNGFFGRQVGMYKSEEEKKDRSLTHKE